MGRAAVSVHRHDAHVSHWSAAARSVKHQWALFGTDVTSAPFLELTRSYCQDLIWKHGSASGIAGMLWTRLKLADPSFGQEILLVHAARARRLGRASSTHKTDPSGTDAFSVWRQVVWVWQCCAQTCLVTAKLHGPLRGLRQDIMLAESVSFFVVIAACQPAGMHNVGPRLYRVKISEGSRCKRACVKLSRWSDAQAAEAAPCAAWGAGGVPTRNAQEEGRARKVLAHAHAGEDWQLLVLLEVRFPHECKGLLGDVVESCRAVAGCSTGSRQAPKELRLRVGQRGVTWLFDPARDEGWDWCDVVHERERDLLGAEWHSSMRLLLSLMRGLSSESHHKQEAAAMLQSESANRKWTSHTASQVWFSLACQELQFQSRVGTKGDDDACDCGTEPCNGRRQVMGPQMWRASAWNATARTVAG